jgi:hypothetical protein
MHSIAQQKPIWQTAWYWKQTCLYLLAPLIFVLAVLAAFTKTGHLSPPHSLIVGRVIAILSSLSFTLWTNHRDRQRADHQQLQRNS